MNPAYFASFSSLSALVFVRQNRSETEKGFSKKTWKQKQWPPQLVIFAAEQRSVGISARLLTNHNNAHHPITQDDVNGK